MPLGEWVGSTARGCWRREGGACDGSALVLARYDGGPFELAVDAAGTVRSRGGGQFGVLGHGDTQDQPLPKVVEARGKNVLQITAKANHSMAVLAGGEVPTSGYGRHGRQLGHGNTQLKQLNLISASRCASQHGPVRASAMRLQLCMCLQLRLCSWLKLGAHPG